MQSSELGLNEIQFGLASARCYFGSVAKSQSLTGLCAQPKLNINTATFEHRIITHSTEPAQSDYTLILYVEK
jgi:hypothetical protein